MTWRNGRSTAVTCFRRRLQRSEDRPRLFAKVGRMARAAGVLAGKYRRALDSIVLDDASATHSKPTESKSLRTSRSETSRATPLITIRKNAPELLSRERTMIVSQRQIADAPRWPRAPNLLREIPGLEGGPATYCVEDQHEFFVGSTCHERHERRCRELD
jgi:hypothetical protein